jgi:hypothetical protein
MNFQDFDSQFVRLRQAYGERYFTIQHSEIIWRYVGELSLGEFSDVVENFIAESHKAPTPSQFSEAVKIYRKSKKPYALGELQPNPFCRDCGDSGFIRLKRIVGFEPWAKFETGSAPCHCNRGKMAIEAALKIKGSPIDLGTQFNDCWATSYKIIQFTDMPDFEPAINPSDSEHAGPRS